MAPCFLFWFFGVGTVYQSSYSIYFHYFDMTQNMDVSHFGGTSLIPIMCYLVSLIADGFIVTKNIQNVNSSDINYTQENKKNQSNTYTKLIEWFKNKDAMVQTLLTENLITLLSTVIPLFFYICPSFYPEWGSLSLGCIQLYIGYKLYKFNYPILMGVAIEGDLLKKIEQLVFQ